MPKTGNLGTDALNTLLKLYKLPKSKVVYEIKTFLRVHTLAVVRFLFCVSTCAVLYWQRKPGFVKAEALPQKTRIHKGC